MTKSLNTQCVFVCMVCTCTCAHREHVSTTSDDTIAAHESMLARQDCFAAQSRNNPIYFCLACTGIEAYSPASAIRRVA